MNPYETMKRLETRSRQAAARDGVTEILLGILLTVYGALFYLATPFAMLAIPLPFLLIPLGRLLRRRYVYPRIGYVRAAGTPGAMRGILVTAVVAVFLLLAALGAFAIVMGLERGKALWLSHFLPAFGGCLIAIGPWSLARTYRLARWGVFGALLVVCGIAFPLTGLALGYDAIALESALLGILSTVYGIGLFTTLIHRVPVQGTERA